MKPLPEKKVCLITDAWTPVWGGGQTHVWELGKSLVKNHRCEVAIVVPCLFDHGEETYTEIEEYEKGRLKVIRIGPRFRFPDFVGRTLFALTAVSFLLRNDFDVIHSHSYPTCLAALIKKVFSPSTKAIFTVHGGGREILGGGILNVLGVTKLLDLFVRRLIPFDVLIGVTASDLAGFSFSQKKALVGNGVDTDLFHPPNNRQETSGLTILNIGRLVPVKNQENLIEAFAEVGKFFPKTRLVMVGDGVLKSRLEQAIRLGHLESSVTILPSVPASHMAKIYNQSDIFILPSTLEGQAISLLEAMSCSLPVIVSDTGESKKIVQTAGCGIVTNGFSSEEIRTSITELLSLSSQERVKMGHRGRDWVKKNCRWEIIAKKIFSLYS